MSVQHLCAQFLQAPEEGIIAAGAGVTVGCEPANECWKLRPSPWEEQPVP